MRDRRILSHGDYCHATVSLLDPLFRPESFAQRKTRCNKLYSPEGTRNFCFSSNIEIIWSFHVIHKLASVSTQVRGFHSKWGSICRTNVWVIDSVCKPLDVHASSVVLPPPLFFPLPFLRKPNIFPCSNLNRFTSSGLFFPIVNLTSPLSLEHDT